LRDCPPGNDLPPEKTPPVGLQRRGKRSVAVAPGGGDIEKGVAVGDVDTALADHFQVPVEGIWEHLTEFQAGLALEIGHQKMVPLMGGPVGVLGQVGVGHRLRVLGEPQLLTLGQVHRQGLFLGVARGRQQAGEG
jgi:hypothetical protein